MAFSQLIEIRKDFLVFIKKIILIMISIQELNKLEFEDFIKLMGNIIEHCPVLTAALWRCRPFSSIEHLILKMSNIVDELPHLGKISFG